MTDQKTRLIFYIQYQDGTSEAIQTNCTNGIKMLKEIQIQKSGIKYAALIKETIK